jgi:hypothetical protein
MSRGRSIAFRILETVPSMEGRVIINREASVTPGTTGVSIHRFALHPVADDTLSAIAQQFYGDPSHWPRIFQANRDRIFGPDLIIPEQTLRISQ